MKILKFKIWLLLFFLFPIGICAQSLIEQFDSLEKELDNLSYLNSRESRVLLNEMYRLAEQEKEIPYLMSRAIYSESLLNVRQGINDTLLTTEINERMQGDIDLYEKTLLMSALNFGVSAKGDFTEAFNLALMILEDAKALNDSLLIARTLNTLGVICKNVNLHNMAENYYKEALKWTNYSSGHSLYPTILINLYSLGLNRKDSSEHLMGDSINQLINTLKEVNETGLLSMIYINTSGYWSRRGEKEKSLSYLLEAKAMHEDNPQRQAHISNNLGLYYLYDMGDFEKALEYFRESQQYWQDKNNHRALTFLYKSMSRLYEAMNVPDSALFYQRESVRLMELTNSNVQVLETHQKYILTSIEVLENRLALAQTEIDLKNKHFTIIILSAIAIVLVISFLLIILLQKRKSIRQEVLLQEAEAKGLKARLEKEQMVQKEKMESKLREITSYSLLLSHKNQVLNQILEASESITSRAELKVKQKISAIVHENVRTDNDWNDFMIHFDKVHPSFFEKTKELYPNISENDLLLVAYIRIGIPTKQIAQMLNVTPESIRTSRYRLKRKMGIDKDANLYDFIRNI